MAFYYKLGSIPPKRHTQFRKPDGTLYSEELISTEGFNSLYSLVYHCHPPTLVKAIGEPFSVEPKIALKQNMQSRSFVTFNTTPEDDYIRSRKALLTNSDLTISVAAPTKGNLDYFFKNSDNDEVIFVHEGTGRLKTIYGEIPFEYGDYLVIPRGTIYQFEFDGTSNRLMITESPTPIYPQKDIKIHLVNCSSIHRIAKEI